MQRDVNCEMSPEDVEQHSPWNSPGAEETSRSITARVIEDDVNRHPLLSRRLQRVPNLQTWLPLMPNWPSNNPNLALPPGFHQVLIESSL
ncbi:hypothetical protein TNCV_2809441 [Trichonephila clavipes]|nr:hypothetical protein TNCV_2809441 [Trichonephila clavipes]